MDTFEKVGLILRSVVYDIIKALYGRSYMLIEVKINAIQEKIKLYTHYEGLQVIDELLLLGEYAKVFELKPNCDRYWCSYRSFYCNDRKVY